MKRVFCLVMLLSMILVMACNSSRMNGNTEGKYIEQRIRKFRKNPSDENLKREIEELYVVAVNQHEARLKAIQSTYDFSRFDRLISEYNEMQRVSDLIRLSPAGSFINTKNYFIEIESVKVTAAEYLYDEALKSMTLNDRTQLKNAWRNFKRISKYVSSFRDADIKIKEVFDRATLDIVVKPVQFRQRHKNNSTVELLLYQLPDRIASDVGSPKYSGIPARFYTNRTLPENFQSDHFLELNITWEPYQVSSSGISRFSRNISRQIKNGVDSMGNQLYKKVEAVIHIERKEYKISGSINYDMIDGQSFRQIHSGTVTSGFSKFIERAKYTGDSRALDVEDWNLINNTKYNYSNDVEVEEELYRRIYPELLRRIKYDVDW